MEDSQLKFIFNKLNTYPVCSIKEKYKNQLKEVSTPVVENILNQKFIRGPDMKAVLCLFDTLFLSSTKGREKGLYNLSNSVQKWIVKMKKLDINSVQGLVYISDILSNDIQVVIKIPRKSKGFNSLVKEYFLGITTLNNLRYQIPTFVYTLGAFLCPMPTTQAQKTLCNPETTKRKNTAFVMYEKIPGDSLDLLLDNKEIDFNQFLEIFVQLLLSLELAQREVQFTHFDLHSGNVMIRPVSNYSYSVLIENTTYNVTTKQFLPVIIDYGFCTVKVEDRVVGEFDYEIHGMMPFMVPGYDMYKFLIFCSKYANTLLRKQIAELFVFYGKDDKYNIASSKGDMKNIKIATREYCKQGTYTNVAKYTPLMFLKWIIDNPDYNRAVRKYLKIENRRIYTPIYFSSTIREYDNIFKHGQQGREKAIKLADSCIQENPSYVMSMYNIGILTGYNKYLEDFDISSKIKSIKALVKANKQYMIEVDTEVLKKYKEISIPNEKLIKKAVYKMLSIDIKSKQSVKEKLQTIKDLNIFKFYYDLKPYLQFVYTIREVGIEDEFSDFLNDFLTSPQYMLYTRNVNDISQAVRWSECIHASINFGVV